MRNISRRKFVEGAAATSALAALAGCAGTSAPGSSSSSSAPSADKYPIDPDGSDVKALWTSEKVRDGWTKVTNPDGGATLGVMDAARIIQVDGLAFRDMNGDGKLELWEDWRQSADDRAKALADSLTADQCIKLMWHGGVQGMPDVPGAATDANDMGLLDKGSCAGVSRLSADGESYASAVSWINQVQQKCEERENGIPYICSTDPYATLGIPSTVGLAPAMDKDLWRKAGMWISRAWRSMGVRCELGPQIDLYTNPTTARLNGAESEDPQLVRDFVRAFGGGLQSTWGDDDATDDKGWGSESIAIMLKHFVGAGAIEGGRNDHLDAGKYDVFPADNYKAHLIGFMDGGMQLDSKTKQMSAIMPNYGIAYSEDKEYGELMGGGFNKKQISILRNAGWDGMITTDWGIITSGCGTEGLDEKRRYRLMLDATVDQYGGGFEPDEVGAPVYKQMVSDMGEDKALARMQDSARRIFKLMVNVELFDQPYSDRTVAADVFGSSAASDFADECNDKCIIMLKNTDKTISSDGLGDKVKVYIPQLFTAASSSFSGTTPASIGPCFDSDVARTLFDVVTDTVGSPSAAPADGGTNNQYQESDLVRATASEIADVKYAIVKIQNPQDAYDGVTGGPSMFGGGSNGPVAYHPISLQYRPYTAVGSSVRQVSLAGDTLADGTKENRSYYGQSTYATNEAQLDLVINTKKNLPKGAKLILIVDADHPMIFSEIEPYADVILMSWAGDAGPSGSGFNVPDTSFARVFTGKTEPTGLLAFQMPIDMDTVESQQEDVPRDMECYVDSEGNSYDFAFGLNWEGVIDDDRTRTYKANPLTQPDTEVNPSA